MQLLTKYLFGWMTASVMGIIATCQLAFMGAEYHPLRWVSVPYMIVFMSVMFLTVIKLVQTSDHLWDTGQWEL